MIYNTPLTLEWMLGSSHVRGMLYIMVMHDTTSRRFVILGNNCIQHPSHIDLNLTNTRSNCVWKKCCSNQYKRNHLIQGEGVPGLIEFILYYKIYEQKVWRCSKKTKKKGVFTCKKLQKKNHNQYMLPTTISFYQKFTTIISQTHQGTSMFKNATSL